MTFVYVIQLAKQSGVTGAYVTGIHWHVQNLSEMA